MKYFVFTPTKLSFQEMTKQHVDNVFHYCNSQKEIVFVQYVWIT